ncbi:MAG: Ribonuclease 3 [Parcubacteria group bacterium GW2011_GWC2_39_14]|nr:MAG: Ribonuclease 3 [Parcubacteria group bacterium GW2011_GWC2_39_14]KKR53225.1 MAG: Ribonuclease 3 [Parcubacteria group bacterium GW2011_GWA2_40_23]
MEKDFSKIERKIKVKFKNPDLLESALVHRSYLNEHPSFGLDHNERLEFLGDAVLELVVTEYLYNNFPNPEGELTNWRASLVNAKTLSTIGQGLSLDEGLYLSRGEQKDTGKARQVIIANAMESVIGAIYLDQGWDAAQKFITMFVLSKLPEILDKKLYLDPKSSFQEIAQEKTGITPIYKILSEVGPDHDKVFEIGVYLKNDLISKGSGSSKQEAQEDAARNALELADWK